MGTGTVTEVAIVCTYMRSPDQPLLLRGDCGVWIVETGLPPRRCALRLLSV
jgi:hypothetical protein